MQPQVIAENLKNEQSSGESSRKSPAYRAEETVGNDYVGENVQANFSCWKVLLLERRL